MRKLMLVSSAFNFDGCVPEFAGVLQRLIEHDDALADVLRKGFQRAGARPEQWPRALTRAPAVLARAVELADAFLDPAIPSESR